MKLVALLPMKANSERVKGKNFREFAGKPLFKWILETLLSMDSIELVVINTDARLILAEYGITQNDRLMIRDRKPELCGETISMNRVLEDDIENVEADCYLMTHTTNPLLKATTLLNAWGTYSRSKMDGSADSLFTVNRVQTRFYRADGSPVNHDPNNLVRTQDLEVWFEENSNLYIFSRESFASTGARIGKRPTMFETRRQESMDIDDQAGWELAELVALGAQVYRNQCGSV